MEVTNCNSATKNCDSNKVRCAEYPSFVLFVPPFAASCLFLFKTSSRANRGSKFARGNVKNYMTHMRDSTEHSHNNAQPKHAVFRQVFTRSQYFNWIGKNAECFDNHRLTDQTMYSLQVFIKPF